MVSLQVIVLETSSATPYVSCCCFFFLTVCLKTETSLGYFRIQIFKKKMNNKIVFSQKSLILQHSNIQQKKINSFAKIGFYYIS